MRGREACSLGSRIMDKEYLASDCNHVVPPPYNWYHPRTLFCAMDALQQSLRPLLIYGHCQIVCCTRFIFNSPRSVSSTDTFVAPKRPLSENISNVTKPSQTTAAINYCPDGFVEPSLCFSCSLPSCSLSARRLKMLSLLGFSCGVASDSAAVGLYAGGARLPW